MQSGVNSFSPLGNQECPSGSGVAQNASPAVPSLLRDGHGRAVRYVRLSVTDRCNLQCLYCCNEGKQSFIPHEKVLRYEEMARLIGVMTAMGVGKVRLTGGEPFVRKGCEELIWLLRRRFPLLDLRMTSNGTLLEPHIPLLRSAGVAAINLSLDSFDRATFARVTGRDLLPAVLASLDGLLRAGIRVKINAVAMRGVNDGQVDDFVHAVRSMPVDMRFIEFMPMGEGTLWKPEVFWPAAEIRAQIERRVRLFPVAADAPDGGPARMFAVQGGRGRVGFIAAMSCHFCASCNRMRLTSDGHLRTCLFDDKEYRLRGLLRNVRITDSDMACVVQRVCAVKPVGADILRKRHQGEAVAGKKMVGIGG